MLLWVAGGARPLPVTYGRSAVGVIGVIASPLAYAAVGGILAARLPRNPIGWLFLVAAAAIGTMLPVNLLVASTLESLRPASPEVVTMAWVRSVFAIPVMLTALVVAAAIFPNGHALPGRWRWAIWATCAGAALLAFVTAADPQGLPAYPAIPNPTSLPYALTPAVDALQLGAFAIVVPCVGLAAASVWIRYRRGDSLVRAQLRWIVLGVGLAAVCVIPYLVVRYAVPVSNDAGEIFAALAQIGSCAFPIAAAFAISRYRLFDVDVLIGRTLVYLPLTAMLGGMYTAGIALFQRMFVAVTGETSDLAIVLAILMVATAFTPLRRAVEGFVERRFPALVEPLPAPPASPPPPASPSTPTAGAGGGSVAAPPVPAEAGRPDAVVTPEFQVLAMDADGSVRCPLGGSRTLYDCLSCSYFRATARHPAPAVICAAREPASHLPRGG
jgi:hypothetical protein